ncbi:MAG: radical SAM protein [Nanoarchaeota archaeon]|nr:radical SAM protein [Nanoarchaeota archaeon]
MRNYVRDWIYACKISSYRAFGSPFTGPSRLHIAMTYLCNSKCKMCSIWKIYKKNRGKLKEEFTSEEFKKIIDNYPKFRDIWLTGGEPLLRKDAVELMKYIDENTDAWFSFNTNAVLLDMTKRKMSQLLKIIEHDFGMGISIDGFEETHDFQRGVKGNWRNAIELLKWSMRKKEEHSNFHPTVTFTMTKWNVKEFPRFVDFLVEMGVNPRDIVFGLAAISSTYYHCVRGYAPGPKEASDRIKEVMEKYREFRNYYVKGLLKYMERPFKMRCYAGYSFNYVDPYLNVYPCIYMEEPVGNLRDHNYDILKLWRSKKANEVREKVRRHTCPDCPWNLCAVSPNMVSNPLLFLRKGFEKLAH